MSTLARAVLGIAALTATITPARAVPPAAGGALASPNVDLVATLPEPGAIGGRILGNTMYVTASQGLRIYDVSGGIPLLQGALELPNYQNEDVDTNGEILLIASDHFFGSPRFLYVIDVSNPLLPRVLGRLSTRAAHTATCINGCEWAWLGGGDGFIEVVDLRDPAAPRVAGSVAVPGYTHDVQVDEAGLAWVSTTAGLRAYSTTNPLAPMLVASAPAGTSGAFEDDFTLHNSLRPDADAWSARTGADDGTVRDGELLLVTEEDWLSFSNGMCAEDGVFQTGRYVEVGGQKKIERIDTFHIGRGTVSTEAKAQPVISCSSHYFDYRAGVAAVAWYEQGTRFLSIDARGRISQVGYFLPVAGEAISALWNGEYAYVFDTVRGIDVLRFTPATSTVLAPRLNAPVTERAPSERWGMLCRVPA